MRVGPTGINEAGAQERGRPARIIDMTNNEDIHPVSADDKFEVVHMHNAPDPTPGDADLAAAKGQIVQMRSELDDMSVFKAVWYYKKIWMVCMLAAFSASLEGYRELPT